uniref:Uncharacterized protein n=1 Tax=Anguilla anguilla TaxID=7936 RepID=A0A0E9WRY3_ANGAN
MCFYPGLCIHTYIHICIYKHVHTLSLRSFFSPSVPLLTGYTKCISFSADWKQMGVRQGMISYFVKGGL